jgi:hypothetical protein
MIRIAVLGTGLDPTGGGCSATPRRKLKRAGVTLRREHVRAENRAAHGTPERGLLASGRVSPGNEPVFDPAIPAAPWSTAIPNKEPSSVRFPLGGGDSSMLGFV